MKKTVLVLLLSSLLLLCGCAGAEERAFQSGQKALAAEQYGDAVAAFEKAGTFQDAARLKQYASAMQALELEDYTAAYEGFLTLGGFKDSLLMASYTQGREQEALAQAAIAAGDEEVTASAAGQAISSFLSLPLFRDSDARSVAIRELLYDTATEWMDAGRYDAAASSFLTLDNWQDSALLQTYCHAAALADHALYPEAAALFSEISDFRDSAARSAAALEKAYQQALDLKNHGDYQAAIAAFESLVGYRDAASQRDAAVALLIRQLLHGGQYTDALHQLSLLDDTSVFPAAEPVDSNVDAFLSSFCNVWMSAHANLMTAFYSCNLLQPYLEPGGELDTQIREEILDDGTPLNYGFIFRGTALQELLALDDAFLAARVNCSASWNGFDGLVDAEESLWVLLDVSHGTPLAAAVFA